MDFKGVAGSAGFNAVKTDKAGWRYGFVAYQKNGKRVYSEVGKDANGSLQFKVPKDTEFLWLTVMGAPTEHWPIPGRPRNPTPNAAPVLEEQWPYQIKLTGTSLVDSIIK